jgi:hypothetical protein
MVKWVLYKRRRDDKQSHLLEGAYIWGKLHIFEYKLPPQPGPYLLQKRVGGGLFSGGYGTTMCVTYFWNFCHRFNGEFFMMWPTLILQGGYGDLYRIVFTEYFTIIYFYPASTGCCHTMCFQFSRYSGLWVLPVYKSKSCLIWNCIVLAGKVRKI